MWPGVTKLPNWHEFPQWSPNQNPKNSSSLAFPNLSASVPNLDDEGLDLLSVS